MKRNGFTLVEVLIVVAIFGVLAALLFPALWSVRSRARQSCCLSNLRQIGVAISLYAQDNDQYFPHAGDPVDKYTNVWTVAEGGQFANEARLLPMLPDVLHPYTKDAQLWHCSADFGSDYVDANTNVIGLSAHPSFFAVFGSSYYYRTELGLEHKITDLVGYDTGPPYEQHSAAEINILCDDLSLWHGGRYNTLMGDGHVVSLSRDGLAQAWSLDIDPPDLSNLPPST